MEHNPEAFAQVYMLYVPCTINGHQIKAFVDSGAQSTIISKSLAEKCGLMRLIDPRFAGVAKGVGTAKILGRIHLVQMKMGNQFFPCSLTVLDQDGVEFLFGLDMLRRHQAMIDLKQNCLRIGDEEVHFLAEKDLPKYAKDVSTPEEKKEQPPLPSISQPAAPPAQPRETTMKNAAEEANIKILTDLGFSRADSIEALKMFNGNSDLAASFLFQRSHGF